MTKTMYVVVSEYPAIVRYDFAFWNQTIEAKGIMEKMENTLACVAVNPQWILVSSLLMIFIAL